MELDIAQRLMLVNQYMILEKLYPEEADTYARLRKALEGGYTLHYRDAVEFFSEELSEDECKFVLDVLDMYRSFSFSLDEQENASSADRDAIHFPGFDGNNESQYLSYCKYFIVDLDRYRELRNDDEYPDFNSHNPMVDAYRKQLRKWKARHTNHRVTIDQIREILDHEVEV